MHIFVAISSLEFQMEHVFPVNRPFNRASKCYKPRVLEATNTVNLKSMCNVCEVYSKDKVAYDEQIIISFFFGRQLINKSVFCLVTSFRYVYLKGSQ